MEFTRDFDAPVEALFRAHADPARTWSSSGWARATSR
jgi:uncharacterized protein YndB with AHSA1/START domain